jgi:hypothetical protein
LVRKREEEENDGPTVRVAGGGRVVLLLLHPLGGPLLPDLLQLPRAQQKIVVLDIRK